IIEEARVAAEEVFELLEAGAAEQDDGGLGEFTGAIEFSDVSSSYDSRDNVLNDNNLTSPAAPEVALVGHTASGKSSIINLLMRFYDPDEGQILFDGQDTTEISKQSLRQKMSIVLQDPFIYSGSLLYNIRLNNEDISAEAAVDALASVGGGELL